VIRIRTLDDAIHEARIFHELYIRDLAISKTLDIHITQGDGESGASPKPDLINSRILRI